MKVNVTNEEFEVLCQRYYEPLADQLLDKDLQKGYIQQCGEIISYLKFLEDLDAGSNEESQDSLNRNTQKESFQPMSEKKPEIQAPAIKSFTSDECDQLIYRLKTKV